MFTLNFGGFFKGLRPSNDDACFRFDDVAFFISGCWPSDTNSENSLWSLLSSKSEEECFIFDGVTIFFGVTVVCSTTSSKSAVVYT